jgi:hypothetical protein
VSARAAVALIRACGVTATVPRAGRADDETTRADGLRNTLRWTTASELELFGFDVYRGPSREGPWTRITPGPIRAAGTTDTLQRYVFEDAAIEPDTAYWYWIESVSFQNVRKRYTAPLWAAPKPAPANGQRLLMPTAGRESDASAGVGNNAQRGTECRSYISFSGW